MLRSLLLFLHVASAMGIFVALGIETAIVAQVRGDQRNAGTVLSRYGLVQRVGAVSIIALLVTGIYLATAFWHWQGPWIGIGFLLVIVIAVIGATMSGRPVARALRAQIDLAAPAGIGALGDSLAASLVLRAALLSGVVFLMTVKPTTSAMALGVAAIAALLGVASVPLVRRVKSSPNEQRSRV